jgi:transposase
VDALPHDRSGRPVGSGRSLSDEQAAHIQALIDYNSPEKLGIASPLWTRPAVRDLIKKEYGIDLAVRTVGEYLKRWGYTAKRPRRHAKKQDPEEVRRWLEETYPDIERQAQEEDAEIHWCDETGVAADKHPHTGYARKGQPVSMEVPESHIRMNTISTVSNSGEVHFMTYSSTMTAALFIVFLQKLLRETSRKIYLITDRLRAHDSAAVAEWAEQHSERIEVFFLPRYAPERNPDEYLNNDLKGNVHAAGLPNNKGELGSRIQAFLHKLLKLPEHVRSYFQHPCVQYALGS